MSDEPPSSSNAGSRINIIRRKMSMSQSTLADLSGIAAPELSKLISGRIPLTYTYARRLATPLQVPAEYLIRGVLAKSDVPNILTSDALTGYWMTYFRVVSMKTGKRKEIENITIERVDDVMGNAEGVPILMGETIGSMSTMESVVYSHAITLKMRNENTVSVEWDNFTTGHFGSGLLILLNDRTVMRGCHLGISSDNVVRSGEWIWCRVKSKLEHVSLRDIFLDKSILEWKDKVKRGNIITL